MSRIGKQPIEIVKDCNIEVLTGMVKVVGPLGSIDVKLPDTVGVDVKDGNVLVNRVGDTKQAVSDHGTIRATISNAVEGVTKGFSKELEIVGIGYRASLEGQTLVMKLGWNHPVKFDPPEGVKIEVPDELHVKISGIDKQLVGLTAAKIRAARKPEPYKGKGVRYVGEVVRIKTSKAGKEESE